MEFNQLMIADAAELTAEQQDFLHLHKSIIANGNAATVYFVEAGRQLKEMRDAKKYEIAGFTTFDEYTRRACGIGQRQAYNLISVVEHLSENFLQTNANLGVSKLTVLASMDERDRRDLVADHGQELEDLTTRELDKLRKEYESRIQQMRMEIQSEQSDMQAALQAAEAEKQKLEGELASYKVKPAAEDAYQAELQAKKNEIERLKASVQKARTETEETRKNQQALLDKAVEAERAAVQAAQKMLDAERARLAEQAKTVQIAADPLMSEFKAKFTMWQQIGNGLLELLERMNVENKAKRQCAFNAIVGRWAK